MSDQTRIAELEAERDEWARISREKERTIMRQGDLFQIEKDHLQDAQELIQRLMRERDAAEAERDRLRAALQGMLAEFDKLTRYGSPMAKAANERVAAARAALELAKESDRCQPLPSS